MHEQNGAIHRSPALPIYGLAVDLPCFFPSISSVKTNLSLVDYLRILSSLQYPQFLVSAYDISQLPHEQRREAEALLTGAAERGSIVLMDSGNYESYWKRDRGWRQEDFGSVLDSGVCHMAFSYDEQDPPHSASHIIASVERAVLRDHDSSKDASIIPIVHSPLDLFAEVVVGVAERLTPLMIAVPERELGQGIIARAKTVLSLRAALNTLGYYVPLHLLGTGNPLSIAIFAGCGADSFDGLEWCQTTVDHETALLYHFQLRELFGPQTPVDSVSDPSYVATTLVHNLLFYSAWMKQVRGAVLNANVKALLAKWFPDRFLQSLRTGLPDATVLWDS